MCECDFLEVVVWTLVKTVE